MRIAICTVGSTGDMQPYLAIGLALQAAGHEVQVVSHPFHADRFLSRGLAFHACGPEVTQQQLNEMLDKMLRTSNPTKQFKMLMLEAFFADGEAYFASAKAALARCDLALVHMVDFLSSEAAAQLGMPRIGGLLAPAGIPTAYAPPPLLPDLGMRLNRWQWRLVAWALRHVDRACTDYLRRLGGPHVDVQGFHVLSPALNLLACSTAIAPVHADLPTHIEPVGPWIVPDPGFAPPPDLAGFLARHPAPVMVSLGSMGGSRGPWLTAQIIAALRLSGKAAVIQGGYSGLHAADAPDNVFFADYLPHEWLFPQASCVVHHGGAGTSTAVARAGVPHVPLVFFADQPYFARHLERLGVAPRQLWHRHLTPGRLAARIAAAHDPGMRARAAALAPVVRAETDMARTVARIERFLAEGK